MRKIILFAAAFVSAAVPSFASDHRNLEEGLPTEMQDAYAVAFRNREIQGFVRYIREEKGKNKVEYVSKIEIGIAPNTQLAVEAQFLSGNWGHKEGLPPEKSPDDDKGNNDIAAELLYNFNTESVWVPATALAVKGDFPTGQKRKGTEITTKVILTKTPVVRSTLFHRLHVNLEWTHKTAVDKDEREDRYKGIFGFDVRAGKDSLFIVDYIREQKEKKKKDANIVEAGFRVQLTPFTLVTIGAGAGIGEDSDDFRVIGGFQHSITWF